MVRSWFSRVMGTPRRVPSCLCRPQVCKLIDQQAWGALLDADQLKSCISKGEAFVGYSEGTTTFSPTFKVERKAATQYKDQRIPSCISPGSRTMVLCMHC